MNLEIFDAMKKITITFKNGDTYHYGNEEDFLKADKHSIYLNDFICVSTDDHMITVYCGDNHSIDTIIQYPIMDIEMIKAQ